MAYSPDRKWKVRGGVGVYFNSSTRHWLGIRGLILHQLDKLLYRSGWWLFNEFLLHLLLNHFPILTNYTYWIPWLSPTYWCLGQPPYITRPNPSCIHTQEYEDTILINTHIPRRRHPDDYYTNVPYPTRWTRPGERFHHRRPLQRSLQNRTTMDQKQVDTPLQGREISSV